MIMFKANTQTRKRSHSAIELFSEESVLKRAVSACRTLKQPGTAFNAPEIADSKVALDAVNSLISRRGIGFRWLLFNCDEKWMRYIYPGYQVIRWKTFCWFVLCGVQEKQEPEKLSFAEIFPCAGRQEVVKVNGLAVREPRRLYAGDIISVMNEIRWEVRQDLAVINNN